MEEQSTGSLFGLLDQPKVHLEGSKSAFPSWLRHFGPMDRPRDLWSAFHVDDLGSSGPGHVIPFGEREVPSTRHGSEAKKQSRATPSSQAGRATRDIQNYHAYPPGDVRFMCMWTRVDGRAGATGSNKPCHCISRGAGRRGNGTQLQMQAKVHVMTQGRRKNSPLLHPQKFRSYSYLGRAPPPGWEKY